MRKVTLFILALVLMQGFVKMHAADEERIFAMKPYLQSMFHDGVTVIWDTRVPTQSWIEYGTDKYALEKKYNYMNGVMIAFNTHHKFRLENLKPNTTYYYRACSREIKKYTGYEKAFGATAQSPIYSFTTHDDKTTSFTAIIYNDVHCYESTLQKLHSLVKDIPHDIIVFNGDCAAEAHDKNDLVRILSMNNNIVDASQIPVLYIRGNHETRDAYAPFMDNYIELFGDKTYGAFNWGDTRFVVLDCGEDKPDATPVYYGMNDFSIIRQAQSSFLRSEIKSKAFRKASRRVMISHVPLVGNVDEYQPCRDLWMPIIKDVPFDISLNGHVHTYAYYPSKKGEHAFPVMVGGGPFLKDKWMGTVAVLQKRGEVMTLKVIQVDGKVLLDTKL
jgi:Calcineurin-like phosphoesterase.